MRVRFCLTGQDALLLQEVAGGIMHTLSHSCNNILYSYCTTSVILVNGTGWENTEIKSYICQRNKIVE